ncbi:phage major capsid protein [Lactiplantibacillus plantarum]|uniref:phage major capsid protein n=1 Tax=Lactiplantibacillus plantarum TaxID=1590 RepID=UPI00270B49FC|nr:phage major capsid protein [Lactiplantibacillus plantarum]MDO7797014.1 phage major capsid protein [Lactiplantibacillus plantarum]
MIKDLRLVTNAELRAQQPQGTTPEDAKTDDQKPDDKQPKTIEGYALLFNSPSKDLGGFVEVIDPKALDGVDLSNVIMLDQHDYSKPLASVKAGTLELTPDDKGLHFTATLDDSVSYANDAYQNVKSGNVDSMSFRFDVDDGGDEFTQDEDGKITRTIKQVKDLFEVSTVTIPAYDDSNVQVDKRSYEEFLDNQKGEKQDMTKQTIIDPAQNGELRSFETYIKSRGEVRSGLTTEGAQAVVPQEVVTPVFEGANAKQNLAEMATVKKVSVGSGKYPISIPDPTKFLATKAELATIPDVDASVKDVSFEAKTYAGKIYLSNELVDDSAIDIKAEVQSQLQQLVLNTDNHNVISLLQTLTSENAANVDDLKKIKNTAIDPAVLGSNGSMVITNQDGYNYLDTLKDSQGRYLLSEDVTAQSGKALFGLPVVVVSNAVLPDVSGQFPVFIGNLPQTIAVFRRNNITTNWEQFDSYSQGLAVIYRGDYEFVDENAMQYVLLGTPAK